MALDVSQIGPVYEDVRNDNSDTNWAVFGYEGNSIVCTNKGTGSLNELRDQFQDDQVQFGFLRVISGDEQSKRAKFVFITWVGDNAPVMKKARVSIQKNDVKTVIKSFALELHVTKREELVEEDVMFRVKKVGGANYSNA
eukprot:TRINITY_DN76_c0_g3_i1.p2 TRINITY_DN76_c0_g3~~TRINITY_DN76_c0_g3_i1.p2  ORF type:complete len:140 (-),score=36.02 TRINITY_DN76_c0_g3_i1:550-969(-)